jgi:predicted MPP superfamily phosphohydrolase
MLVGWLGTTLCPAYLDPQAQQSMNRRTFIKRTLIAAPVAAGTGAAYGQFVERHAVEVVPLAVEIGLRVPLTVALLGDIHFDPLYETDYLEAVVARASELSPDVILYTGDFVSHSTDRLTDLAGILREVRAGAGCFAVLGNHDHWSGPDEVGAALTSSGITVLRNQSLRLPGRENWYLTGLESYWAGAPSMRSVEGTPPDSRHIVLVHEPDSFDLLTNPRITLQLSGHTHGGQIRLPLAGAIRLPTWGKKYQAGLYERGGRKLYVNRGIGTVGKQFRVNCRPEITLLRLT